MIAQPIALLNGVWLPLSQVTLGIDDVGFLQGATAVERLRTWGGRLPPLAPHLQRFARSTQTLRIRDLPSPAVWMQWIKELVAKNIRAGESEDLGVTLFATPGPRGSGRPTLCVHPTRLDIARWERLQTEGQPLVISPVRQPDPECWPRDVKVRSRLHYYLADLYAADRDPRALGVLVDEDGSITETSTSNILWVREGHLVLPPEDRVLPGIMAQNLCTLMADDGWTIERRPISCDELRAASHVWMTGSEGGLWPANRVDGSEKTIDDLVRLWQRRLFDSLCHESNQD